MHRTHSKRQSAVRFAWLLSRSCKMLIEDQSIGVKEGTIHKICPALFGMVNSLEESAIKEASNFKLGFGNEDRKRYEFAIAETCNMDHHTAHIGQLPDLQKDHGNRVVAADLSNALRLQAMYPDTAMNVIQHSFATCSLRMQTWPGLLKQAAGSNAPSQRAISACKEIDNCLMALSHTVAQVQIERFKEKAVRRLKLHKQLF